MENNILMSVCIPTYEMGGRGEEFLKRSLDTISSQDCDLNGVEVVVSDHSKNDDIRNCCLNYGKLVKYVRNEEHRGSMSANLNNCIRNSVGKYIKPLFQDDFLFSKDSLGKLLQHISDNWGAHEYSHLALEVSKFYNQRTPFYTDRMKYGENTIGPPSSVFFINDNNFFDESLSWFMDTEFYYRMFLKYGEPTILQGRLPLSIVTTWGGQTTNTQITQQTIDREKSYLKEKYNL